MAVSFFVIILSLAVSGGFRKCIRDGVSDISGDIQLTGGATNYYNADGAVNAAPSFLPELLAAEGVRQIVPTVYRAGIIRCSQELQGVLFKGMEGRDTLSLSARIPHTLAKTLRLGAGDEFTAYFVGERVQARKFRVGEIYDALLGSGEGQIVYVPIADLRRINGWNESEASALEVLLQPSCAVSAVKSKLVAINLAGIASEKTDADNDPLIAITSADKYSGLFDWLNLIDFNVLVILLLMILVAGFNMVSGLLIMLFRNISTIGTLKALGMSDGGISGTFLRVAFRVVLKGMLIGNALALVFCLVQGKTHLLKLNPDNYFVSFVPMHIDWMQVAGVDIIACAAIMLLLLIPSLFIAKVDPAQTVRMR